MIRNERELRIARSSADHFHDALAKVDQSNELETAAIESQLADLRRDIEEYDQLQTGARQPLAPTTLHDLPQALIQARIVRGWTQKDLGKVLGVAAQQIQRYEATDYQSASLSRLQRVADELGVRWPDTSDVFAANPVPGLDRRFLYDRFGLGRQPSATVSAKLGRAFGLDPANPDRAPALAGRFKRPAGSGETASPYTVYACYLAQLVADCAIDVPAPTPPPGDPTQWHASQQQLLRGLLDQVNSHGMIVLPLADPGGFHGAVWRVRGRNIIVLKQNLRHESRWAFDLMHEVFHATEEPEASEFGHYESEIDESDLEQHANHYAGQVLLGADVESLVDEAVDAAGGNIPNLKRAAGEVASRHQVHVGAFAQYLAWRLSLQGLEWWATAHNLEPVGDDPYDLARDRLLSQIEIERLNPLDRSILLDALGSYT